VLVDCAAAAKRETNAAMNSSKAGPFVALGCGGLLLCCAFLVSAFGAYHVLLDPGGHVSQGEAMPALIGGVLCTLVDFVIVGVSIALLVRAYRPPQQ